MHRVTTSLADAGLTGLAHCLRMMPAMTLDPPRRSPSTVAWCESAPLVRSLVRPAGARPGASMARLDLTLLGGFQARLNPGPPLRVPTRKAQALLAYLALPPGLSHPRDKLASLLWGEMRQEQARTNLRQTLFNLRKALPVTAPESLHQDGAYVALDPAAVNVDVATFEALVTQGTPEALTRAATLYQGDLLTGLAVQEPQFEEWLMAERERLRELALEALARLLAQQRATGETEAAVRTALRLIALDPLLETVHRTLMRLYLELDRRTAALRQYQHCVGVLKRELDVEPEAETRQLYQDILRVQERHAIARREAQADTLAPPASRPPGAASTTRVAASAPSAAPIRGGDPRLFTVLAARLDAPEDGAQVQLACVLQELVAKAESFGARTEEITPSSLLAVFGIDSMEDTARRAVHAARAMLQALAPAEDPSLSAMTGRCAIHVGRYLAASAGPAARMDPRARAPAGRIVGGSIPSHA